MTEHSPPTPSFETMPSSQIGRKWLKAADCCSAIDERPDAESSDQPETGARSDQPQHDSADPNATVFHALPDVAQFKGDTLAQLDFSMQKNPAKLADALAKASEERLAAAGVVTTNTEPARIVQPKPETTSTPAEIQSCSVRSDLAEPPTEWTDQPSTQESPRKDSDKPPNPSDQDPAINKLANSILERFPGTSPTVLMFVGSEQNRHTDETCARLAAALAERKLGQVLLLDSDCVGHAISNASGTAGQPGITDVANSGFDWHSTVYGRSGTGLDFIPAGTGAFHDPQSVDRLRTVVGEMKQKYRFLCVAAGNAHSQAARIWSDYCDGSYLLVSLKESNQSLAKSAVAELQSSGARLLGCVVTDVD